MRRNLVSIIVLFAFAMPALGDIGSSILVSDAFANTVAQGDVLKYNASSGAFEGVFIDVPSRISSELLYGPNGDLYLHGGSNVAGDSKIQRYDADTGTFISEFSIERRMDFLTFGPDGDLFGSDFSGDKVHRYDPTNGVYLGEFVTSQSGGLNGPRGLIFGPDDNLYVSSRISGQILRYDGATGAFMNVFATPGGNGPQDLQFGPDGALWVAGGLAGPVLNRYDAISGVLLSTWVVPGNPSDGMSMAFSPDNNFVLVSVANSSAVRRLNATTGADLGDFVASGSGGLIYPTAILYHPRVPEPAVLLPLAVGLLLLRRPRGVAAR
ncbi:MAG TPA: hypothetical protein VJZ71_17355 [Phycisphaerae bacterium]|nr:hypothetical protein [Phycisphaerae bacterium]